MVPTPPEVSGQGPETLLGRSDKAVQHARLADHGRYLACSLDQHSNLILAKGPRILGLHDENTLQNSAINQGNAQERVVFLFSRLLEVLETRVTSGVADGHRHDLLRHQACQAFVERHTQCANAAWVEAKGCGQYQIRSIRLEQIG